MKFRKLIEVVGYEPVFETGLVLAGDVDPADVRKQLSRWTANGRLYQFRRGLYALAPPYQKTKPHPFVIANRMVRGSYVSCESALSHYGLIPEYVPVTTSITAGRPGVWDTPVGTFQFHHIKMSLIRGYRLIELVQGQQAFVATPEKALLDLIYLRPGGDSPSFLQELRLQSLDRLNPGELRRVAESTASPRLERAAEVLAELCHVEDMEYETL
ncbi:MAG: hypothetical protein HYX94_03630 [Chloroflexi bacterium]|nr:hypothetical protein [Chloroflexota bacterium]